MGLVFHLTAYDEKRLLPQVSGALEKRTEILSRERYPGLWKQVDRLNAAHSGKKRSPRRTKVLGAINLALGLFLFIPGLMKPKELLIPLLVGAVGIGAGIGGLYRARRAKRAPKPDRFTEAAEKLLRIYENITEADGAEVIFADSAMILPTDGGAESVPYENFERVVETADAVLLVFDTRVALLQKKDLQATAWTSFRSFLQQRVTQYE